MSRTHNAIWRIKSHWLNKIDIGTPFLMPKYYVHISRSWCERVPLSFVLKQFNWQAKHEFCRNCSLSVSLGLYPRWSSWVKKKKVLFGSHRGVEQKMKKFWFGFKVKFTNVPRSKVPIFFACKFKKSFIHNLSKPRIYCMKSPSYKTRALLIIS